MKNSDLKEELSRLKKEKIKTLRVINSMYFVDFKIRNEQFEKLKNINGEIDRIEFKMEVLKEKKKLEDNNTCDTTF